MRYALLASTLLATPAIAQNTASFAAPSCPGQTFYDDFTQNAGKWSFGGGGSLSDGNDAFASYQSSTQNQTEQFTSTGLDLSILPMPAPNGAQWQAGLMSTRTTFSQTYGYFEAAVDIPPAMLLPGATWSFWLIGYSWPPEIDIAEFSTQNGDWFDSAQHSSARNPDGTPVTNAPVYRYSFSPGQHVFAADWEPDHITWYIDGQQTQQSDTPADFHQPMYIVLGSAATSNISTPATLQVMYVRVFKDMASALACVPKASGPSADEQVSALTSQIQQMSAPVAQPQTTLPTASSPSDAQIPQLQTITLPAAPITDQPQAVPGYDPQFVQAGQQLQQQLQTLLQNLQLPQQPTQ